MRDKWPGLHGEQVNLLILMAVICLPALMESKATLRCVSPRLSGSGWIQSWLGMLTDEQASSDFSVRSTVWLCPPTWYSKLDSDRVLPVLDLNWSSRLTRDSIHALSSFTITIWFYHLLYSFLYMLFVFIELFLFESLCFNYFAGFLPYTTSNCSIMSSYVNEISLLFLKKGN